MRNVLILAALFSFIHIGCRKDPVFDIEEPDSLDTNSNIPGPNTCVSDTTDISTYDTIISDPYLAAYPGSWWQYSDGNYVTCDIVKYCLVDCQIEPHCPEPTCGHYLFDTVFVPRLEGYSSLYHINPRVHENNFLNMRYNYYDNYCSSLNYQETYFSKQIDTLNFNWTSWSCIYTAGVGGCDEMTRQFEYLDSLILPNDDIFYEVIHIEESINLYMEPFNYQYTSHFYYAKEVGLIWQIESPTYYSAGYNRYLTTYDIAPH